MIRIIPILLLSFLFAPTQALTAKEIPIIDAHSQVDHQTDLEKVIKLMNSAGVSKTILSGRGKIDQDEIVSLAKEHPTKIIPAVRTKGGSYVKNKSQYFMSLKSQSNSNNFSAMAEVLLFHASKGASVPKIVVEPDDRRVEAALKVCLQHNWPFIAHIEFAAIGSKQQDFMDKFEEILLRNPKHPFALTHMGQLNVDEVKRLIEKHSNIYFITSHANPIYLSGNDGKNANYPWVNMFDNKAEGYELKNEWKTLIVQYPDRFILGIDIVRSYQWRSDFYVDQVKLWKHELSKLPDDVAHKLAHINAELLWALKPLD